MTARPPTPGLEPWGRLVVDVGEPIDLSTSHDGAHRSVPVLGGRLSGELGAGEILGGWDWQVVASDGTISIDASYPVRLEDGRVISVRTVGIRTPGAGDSEPYFRLTVDVSDADAVGGAAPRLLIASGSRVDGTVVLDIYRLT